MTLDSGKYRSRKKQGPVELETNQGRGNRETCSKGQVLKTEKSIDKSKELVTVTLLVPRLSGSLSGLSQ